MAKHNLQWDENKLKRFLREGRGQGEGQNYKPWVTVQDFPSKGRCSRVLGWKTNRIHHLFTDSETRYFYLLEWEDAVVDIREHYPLLDLEEVVKEKDDLNFKLFQDKNSGLPYIIYTSFLITIKDTDGQKRYIARSLKADYELQRKRSIERLEIERRYWLNKHIDWGVVTQKDIPTVKAKNIEWVHSSLHFTDERGLEKEEMIYLCDVLLEKMTESSQTIRKITADFDKEYKLQTGTGLFIFKHLIATKRIKLDMNKEIKLNERLGNLVIDIKKERLGEDNIVNY